MLILHVPVQKLIRSLILLCDNTTFDWVYTYTISAPIVTLPAAGSSTVACLANATAPTPPVVTDNCGRTLTVGTAVPGADPACAGTKTYTFTYTACDNTTFNWVYTYTISAPIVTLPAAGSSTVACLANATAPTPPVVTDNCGRTLTVGTAVPGADPACAGTKTYTFTYTACDNTTFNWVYTYTISAPIVTLPAAGSSTVACLANATAPTPPVVTDNCGRTLTVGTAVPGADPACAGTKTYTFTYTACDNTTFDWVYTYTISAPIVTPPAAGSSTVACLANATAPTPPVVTDNCGRTLTVGTAVPGADPACAGTKTYTFTYTACDNTTFDWVYTYTISAPIVTPPAAGSSTVACLANATAPTPPVVTDNCGRTLTVGTAVPGADPACAGTKTYTFTYTACDNTTFDWVYTYTISAPIVTPPAAGSSTVACLANATAPTPPVVTDNCGRTLTVGTAVPGADPACAGTKTYTFTYTACDNTTFDWVYTYTISAPIVTPPAAGSSTVACLANATAPTPPVVTDNCGRTLTVGTAVPGADPACAGTKTYTFTYTACDNTTFDWVYTYTISAPIVTPPAAGSSTVACLANATAPTPPVVTDNCGRTLTVGTAVPGADPACAGTKTYTFTYTACDNTTFDWVYTYTISAPIVTPPAAGSSTVACLANATAPTPPVVTDNCGRTLTVGTAVPGADPACAGTKTYTFTYTACDNTTFDWVYTYTISAPIVTPPAAGSSTVACLANATAPTPPVVTDNCGRTLTVGTAVPGADPACAGTKTYTFTYTACDNTTFDWVYTYTISAPIVTPPAAGSSTVACLANATAPTPPVVTDNCGRTLTVGTAVPGADPACAGTKTYTFTYTACDNTTFDWVYTYTISAPIVTPPAAGSSTVACLANATAPTPPVVTDNCGRTLTVGTAVPGADPACAGTKTYTFTYTACDNTTFDWVYTYTISAPIVTPPAAGSSTVACLANATAPTPPVVTDNCGRTLTVGTAVPGADPACAGTKTYTFTYTACDNTTFDWVYTYTISAPIVTPPAAGSSTVACLANATAPTPPVVTDNCGRTLTVGTAVPGADPACAGTKTYTFTYTACDNTTFDWVYTYTISAPIVTPPAAGSSTVACLANATAPTPPVVTDNCGRTLTVGTAVPGADPACAGTKTYTFTYTACDNTTFDWVYTYTISAPIVTPPAAGSSTVACLANATAPTPPVVTDNCGRTLTVGTAVPGADPACAGTKTYTFTYTACDNTTFDWVYTYTISAPIVTPPAAGSSTVACLANATAPTPPVVTDNCGRTLTVGTAVPGADPACAGTKTYTFTYTACDNTTFDWVYTYTISAPIVTPPAAGSSTVACLANATAPTPPVVTDNCGRTLTVGTAVPGADPACAGTKTYTFTYTACDNTTFDWVYTYTISAPIVTPPAAGSSTVACLANATAPTPPVVTDNCGRTLTVGTAVPGADPACAGTKTYTFTYTACDNTTFDWIYTYTITAPDFTLPTNGASTVNCPADAVAPTPPTVLDACGTTITPTVVAPSPTACNGSMVYTFTYIDCAGHSHDWTYTYTITAPDFTLPTNGASTVNCPADAVAPTPPTVLDACGTTITPTVVAPSPTACNGSMVYTFTYVDCAGHSHDWTYTYTITAPDFTLPTNGASTVNCPADAVAPTPPTVLDACGNDDHANCCRSITDRM